LATFHRRRQVARAFLDQTHTARENVDGDRVNRLYERAARVLDGDLLGDAYRYLFALVPHEHQELMKVPAHLVR
jgi:hypothetical protein